MSHWSSPTVPGIQINCMKYHIIGSNLKNSPYNVRRKLKGIVQLPLSYLPNAFYMPGTVLGDL